jgi:hypothetical protein
MTKHNQRNSNRNNNAPAGDEGAAAAPMGETDTAHKVVSIRPSKGNRDNIFAMDEKEVSSDTGHKLQVMQEVRQRLAEAQDAYMGGVEREKEANEIAAKAALMLSTARLSGEVNQEEVSAALIDVFGAKPKSDGTPGKTPNGKGEYIRKRILRLAAAQDYANGEVTDGFFKGCPRDEVADILGRTVNGTLGFWAAYEEFAELKKAQQVSVPLAFNAKRIVEIAETLQKDGAAKQFVSNPALRKAYSSLWQIMRVVGEEAADLAAAA